MARSTPAPPRSDALRRSVALLVAVAAPVLAWVGPGCGTDAVGVEACRQIETARCNVAPRCAGFEGAAPIETEEQVKNCREFYRDHCLLGLENTSDVPGQGAIDACVGAIEKTAACKSPTKSTMAECEVALREGEDPSLVACRVLQDPHLLDACNFLDPNFKEAGEGGADAAATATTTGDASATATSTATVTTGGLPAVTGATGGFDGEVDL